MARRNVLVLMIVLVIGAGCVGMFDDSVSPAGEAASDGVRSSDSSPRIIEYSELSGEAQEEFETALDQGGLLACDIALLNVREPYIRYRGETYTVSAQQGGGEVSEPCGDFFVQVERTTSTCGYSSAKTCTDSFV